jgi:hypothetical protein
MSVCKTTHLQELRFPFLDVQVVRGVGTTAKGATMLLVGMKPGSSKFKQDASNRFPPIFILNLEDMDAILRSGIIPDEGYTSHHDIFLITTFLVICVYSTIVLLCLLMMYNRLSSVCYVDVSFQIQRFIIYYLRHYVLRHALFQKHNVVFVLCVD